MVTQNRAERRQREASERRTRKQATSIPPSEAKKMFEKAFHELAHVGGFSNTVSMTLTGLPTSMQGQLASMTHAKMCVHARSIGAVCQSSMFDHSAIIALSRMLVEGLTFYHYLNEDVSEAEWELRYTTILIHDTVARITLVRAFQEKSEYDDLTQGLAALKAKIQSLSLFNECPLERQKRILSGQEIFVSGMRRAAHKAGWSKDHFTAIYSYYSAHAHTAPISIVRMAMHKIDAYAPSDGQYGNAAMAICIASACLRRASLLALSKHPEKQSSFPASYLEAARTDDRSTTAFGAARPTASTQA